MKQSTPAARQNALRRYMTPITVAVIVLVLLANLGLAALLQYKSLYVDLTPENLYTLSDEMIRECDKIDSDITITFCDDPDRLLANFETRYVYILATELANRYDNINVETYNLTLNPTALDKFRTTSASRLQSNYVIISSGERYRVYNSGIFWVSDSSSTEDKYYSFDGEYTMATAFFSLTAINTRVAYFVYGHGESIYVSPDDTEHADLLPLSNEDVSAFYELLLAEGLKVDYINLSEVDEIPEDCAALIVNGPTSDFVASDLTSYYDRSETELIDRYLNDDSSALLVFKDPDYQLPNLEQFCAKWGIAFGGPSIVKDEVQSLGDAAGTARELWYTRLLADYNHDTDTYSYGIYQDLLSLSSAPAVVVDRTGTVSCAWPRNEHMHSGSMESAVSYSDFLFSSKNAKTYSIDGNYLSGEADVYSLAALSTKLRVDKNTGRNYYSYAFGAATTNLTTNEYLTDFSCANYDVMYALVRSLARVNFYADSALGSTDPNSENVGGKPLIHSQMKDEPFTDYVADRDLAAFTSGSLTLWSVIIVLVPLAVVPIVGAVVCIRRRFL